MLTYSQTQAEEFLEDVELTLSLAYDRGAGADGKPQLISILQGLESLSKLVSATLCTSLYRQVERRLPMSQNLGRDFYRRNPQEASAIDGFREYKTSNAEIFTQLQGGPRGSPQRRLRMPEYQPRGIAG